MALTGGVHLRKIWVPDTDVALSKVGECGIVSLEAKTDETPMGETSEPQRSIVINDIPSVFLIGLISSLLPYNYRVGVISRISTQD